MKSNRKKSTKSLYVHLTVSFIIILIIMIFLTTIYFLYFHRENGETIRNLMNQFDIKLIQNRVGSATIYGTIVGVALVLVVASHIIKPIRKISEATKKVAAGDFKVKVDIKRRDEIGNLAENFNTMVKELNSIEYLRKDFISNVSHELKTPIASIQGFAKLLTDDNITKEEKQEYVDIILEETSRLSNLSSNIMKLSKFENQEIVSNKETYRLDEQIRKAIIMLEENITEKNINITLNSEEIYVTEDKDLIMEIWINLLDNAVKYTNENGIIDVSISDEDGFVKVQIKDNGIGIAKEKQERIFEKFYQAEKSHSYEGSGLGLSIVKKIIDLVGGKITFKSEEGKGTTFYVYLKQNFIK